MIKIIGTNHLTLFLLWFFLPIVVESAHSYLHKISTSHGYCLDDCEKFNDTAFNCSSLQQVFNLLSQNYSSVDNILDPGIFNLTTSHTITNVHHIQITSKNATIQCGTSVDNSSRGIASY